MQSFLNKLQRWMWYVLLVVAPWQTRVILWQRDWYFSEWRSIAIWASDVVIVVLIGATFIQWLQQRQLHQERSTHDTQLYWAIGALIVSAVISSTQSLDHTVAWWTTVKLIEFILLWWAIRRLLVSPLHDPWTWAAIALGGIMQAGIAVGQFYHQGDLGLRWVGETLLRPGLAGVASFYLADGTKLMRAYGTLPHPNLLAAYLVIALAALVGLWFHKPNDFGVLFRRCVIGAYAFCLWALFLTFSRTVIVVAGLIGLVWVVRQWRRFVSVIAVTLVVAAVFVGVHWPAVHSRIAISRSDEAVQLRIYYNDQAIHATPHAINLVGVGPGNFVTWLMRQHPHAARYLYQPAHNLYLLIYAEQGIVGIGIWFIFVILSLRSAWFRGPVSFGLVLFLLAVGLFDHFPWTLQQGRIMLWGVLGIAAYPFRFLPDRYNKAISHELT